ncbi:hypothetical protein WJX72_011162 [[Myrmecia] bisecta]|uniref:DUF1349 domain-containing protein n=1 Tax=[Myrmecia] bisecta TaxID=41462 RepID=A0AAW1PQZ4_9CHLO
MDQDRPLQEEFGNLPLDPRLSWTNPPPCDLVPGGLHVKPAGETDYWQRTHYGFQHDNGHFLAVPECVGDFVLSTSVSFCPHALYDQAGLMVRISPECWIKTCVENVPPGPSKLGAVVTNSGYSDWSTTDVPADTTELELRIRREGTDYVVEAWLPGWQDWMMIRMAHLLEDREGGPIAAGLFACCPTKAGFSATFRHLTIAPGRLDKAH